MNNLKGGTVVNTLTVPINPALLDSDARFRRLASGTNNSHVTVVVSRQPFCFYLTIEHDDEHTARAEEAAKSLFDVFYGE